MAKEFFEIVLSKLINERDMLELDINNLMSSDSDSNEKSDKFILLLEKLTIANNKIEALTGMLPEEVFENPPEEVNNNN